MKKESLNQRIKKAKECALRYGIRARIIFNIQGYDLGIDEPIYWKEQAKMVEEIKQIMGGYAMTDIYTY